MAVTSISAASPELTSTLQRILAGAQRTHRVPSIVAGVVWPGGSWTGTAGTTDAAAGGQGAGGLTQYRIGSMTKTFTAVLLLQMRDAGLLSLDDPLSRFVPDSQVGDVTLFQLLSHTGGLAAEPEGPWWERSAPRSREEILAGTTQHQPRGRAFHYSNVGYGLAGMVVEAVSGTTWESAVEQAVLRPLGLRRTSLTPAHPFAPGLTVHPHADLVHDEPLHDGGALAPAGMLWSSIDDQMRWTRFLLGDTGGVLAPSTLEEMTYPYALAPQRGMPWRAAYGLGLQILQEDATTLVGHTGSLPGFQSVVLVDRESGVGVVVLCNSGTGWGPDLLRELRQAVPVAGEGAWSALSPDEAGDGALVGRFSGVWYWGGTAWTLAGDRAGGFTLTPAGGAGARAGRFVRREHGSYVGLDGYYRGETAYLRENESAQWLEVATFVFTRTPYDPEAPVPGGVTGQGWRPAARTQ